MEADFIRQLERQAYERVNITCEADLIANLQYQIVESCMFQLLDCQFYCATVRHIAGKFESEQIGVKP